MIEVICWMDIESTGTEASQDEILEVACLLTDVEGRRLFDQEAPVDIHALFALTERGRQRLEEQPFVLEMHARNGLLDELEQLDCFGTSAHHVMSPEDFELRLASLLPREVETRRVAIGGRNVLTFERPFLNEHMRGVLDLLGYRSVDLTSIEALTQGTWLAFDDYREEAPHRAIPDTLRELRRYRALRTRLKELAP